MIGFPTGILIIHFTTIGPFGYWIGLIIGLATGAITLFLRLRFSQNSQLKNKSMKKETN